MMDSLSDMAESFVVFFLAAIPKLLQVGGNGGVELRGCRLLLAQRRRKALHLFLERFPVIFLRLCTHVAPGREHVAVPADFVEGSGFAEASYVAVFTPISVFPRRGGRVYRGAAPRVISACDASYLVVSQLAMSS